MASENAPTMPAPDATAPPVIAHVLLDARGDCLSERDPQRPFYAASTIKLHVLIAALAAVDRGELDLDLRVPATRTFTGVDGAPFSLEGDHLDPTHPADGTPVPVHELLTRMIDRSSNEATDTVIELVGLDAVAREIDALGLTGTRAERLIGDAAAISRGLTNETTAADLARTMLLLARGDVVSPASTGLALAALRAQRIRVIADAVRSGIDVGSKSGEVDGVRHDVAFLGDPASSGLRVLAVMTSGLGLADADRAVQEETRRLVPDLAR